MPTWVVVAAIAAASVFAAAAVIIAIAAIKLWRAVDSAKETLDLAREELLPLLKEAREAVRNLDQAAVSVKDRSDRLGRLITIVEEVVGGGAFVAAATKAAQGGSSALKAVVEGLKVGLRALRSAPKD